MARPTGLEAIQYDLPVCIGRGAIVNLWFCLHVSAIFQTSSKNLLYLHDQIYRKQHYKEGKFSLKMEASLQHYHKTFDNDLVITSIQYQYHLYLYPLINGQPVDWREIFMKQSVGKCKQINF